MKKIIVEYVKKFMGEHFEGLTDDEIIKKIKDEVKELGDDTVETVTLSEFEHPPLELLDEEAYMEDLFQKIKWIESKKEKQDVVSEKIICPDDGSECIYLKQHENGCLLCPKIQNLLKANRKEEHNFGSEKRENYQERRGEDWEGSSKNE